MPPKEKPDIKRVMICLPAELLATVDREAYFSSQSRSGFIRQALVSFLRSNGNTDEETPFANSEELLKILQRQRALAGIHEMLRDMKKQQARARQQRQLPDPS